MSAARPNPFALGMQHAEAGKSIAGACPYPKGSRERIRYVSGHHAGEARAAHPAPEQPDRATPPPSSALHATRL